MSDVGKTEAQAPVTEAVAENEPVVTSKVEGAVVDAETPEEAGEEGEATEKTAEKTAEEIAAEALEGAEKEGEDKKTPSARKREKIKARIDALEAENQRLTEQLAAGERNKPKLDELGPKPDRAKYEDEAEYISDLSAWKVRKDFSERQAKTHETNTTNLRSDSIAAKVELFFERARALEDTYPGIEKLIRDDGLPISQVMRDTLVESEKGPEVVLYLSGHRDEAQRIKEMSPLAAAAALGRLEAKLSLPKTRTETKAPPPPPTVSGSVRGPAKKLEDMSMAEYRKARGFD